MRHLTGTRDQTYDLVSVLYHLLQGAETFVQYIEDATRGGDSELAEFFRELLEEDRDRANRAKALLMNRLGRSKAPGQTTGGKKQRPEDEVEEASMESFPASDSPQQY